MKRVKQIIPAAAFILLFTGLTACSDDDDAYNTPTSPDVVAESVSDSEIDTIFKTRI
ncbi:MAG: hypothetical protein JJU46_04050 [Balneolaceae bacterium]|nr:hypothetical protein [Balneolaceae bacterium]MCH8547788.1 hypothetical protein [Balneolaceae bacterium]